MKKIKNITAVICAVLMLLSCTACSGLPTGGPEAEEIPESTAGKDVVAQTKVDNVFSLNCNHKYSFNPLIATNHSNQLVCSLVYENLVELDDEFNVHPNIATEWSCNEEGTYWTVKLDTSHTFHDGTPLTGKDVRYSIERSINSDRFLGRFASFQGINYDNDTVYIALGIGDSDFIKLLNIPIIKSGSYPDDYPMGSGPYMYNEDYTALLPYAERFADSTAPFDTIYLREYADAESIISAFEDGYIDAVLNDPSSYTNLGFASTNEQHSFATTNFHYVGVNVKEGVCSDSAFRYALNFAFDREYLATLLRNNAVASPVGMYPTCSLYPTELAESLKYDPDICRIVFENVGLKDYDNDGYLEYLNGANKVKLDFIVCSDSSAKSGIANKFADDMDALGIKVNVRELTWAAYMTALEEGDFDLYYAEVKLRANFDLTEILQVRDEDNERTNINYTNCTDKGFEGYIDTYLAASEYTKKAEFKALSEYIANQAVIIPIGFEKQQLIVHRGVIRGLDPNIGNPFYGIKDWEIIL